MLKKVSTPTKNRLWYNDWVEKNAKGKVLDVGKSKFWDYGFPMIDINPKLNPTFIGNIEKTDFKDNEFDMVLCNGMYECVTYPQKMVDEVMRILKPGGQVIFGFVGRKYYPYKKNWLFYEKGDIDFKGVIKEKDFDNKYHFIICKK